MQQGSVIVPSTSQHDITDMIEMQCVHRNHLLVDASAVLRYHLEVHKIAVLPEQLVMGSVDQRIEEGPEGADGQGGCCGIEEIVDSIGEGVHCSASVVRVQDSIDVDVYLQIVIGKNIKYLWNW